MVKRIIESPTVKLVGLGEPVFGELLVEHCPADP